jgi:hypothetical protein
VARRWRGGGAASGACGAAVARGGAAVARRWRGARWPVPAERAFSTMGGTFPLSGRSRPGGGGVCRTCPLSGRRRQCLPFSGKKWTHVRPAGLVRPLSGNAWGGARERVGWGAGTRVERTRERGNACGGNAGPRGVGRGNAGAGAHVVARGGAAGMRVLGTLTSARGQRERGELGTLTSARGPRERGHWGARIGSGRRDRSGRQFRRVRALEAPPVTAR